MRDEPPLEPLVGVARWAIPVGVIVGTGPFMLAFVSFAWFAVAWTEDGQAPPVSYGVWRLGWFALFAVAASLVALTPVAMACALDAIGRWWSAPTYRERGRWRVRAILGTLACAPAVVFTVTSILLALRWFSE